jgi:hypothetical protein
MPAPRPGHLESDPKPLQSEHLGARLHLSWFKSPGPNLAAAKGNPLGQLQPWGGLILQIKADKLCLFLEGRGGLAAKHTIQSTSTTEKEP